MRHLEPPRGRPEIKHELRDISFCCAEGAGPHQRVFSWICKNKIEKKLECHVVICGSKEKAKLLAATLSLAFSYSYQEYRNEKERKERLAKVAEQALALNGSTSGFKPENRKSQPDTVRSHVGPLMRNDETLGRSYMARLKPLCTAMSEMEVSSAMSDIKVSSAPAIEAPSSAKMNGSGSHVKGKVGSSLYGTARSELSHSVTTFKGNESTYKDSGDNSFDSSNAAGLPLHATSKTHSAAETTLEYQTSTPSHTRPSASDTTKTHVDTSDGASSFTNVLAIHKDFEHSTATNSNCDNSLNTSSNTDSDYQEVSSYF